MKTATLALTVAAAALAAFAPDAAAQTSQPTQGVTQQYLYQPQAVLTYSGWGVTTYEVASVVSINPLNSSTTRVTIREPNGTMRVIDFWFATGFAVPTPMKPISAELMISVIQKFKDNPGMFTRLTLRNIFWAWYLGSALYAAVDAQVELIDDSPLTNAGTNSGFEGGPVQVLLRDIGTDSVQGQTLTCYGMVTLRRMDGSDRPGYLLRQAHAGLGLQPLSEAQVRDFMNMLLRNDPWIKVHSALNLPNGSARAIHAGSFWTR